MRKVSGFIFAVLMLLSLNLYAESEGYSQWLKRRDALKKDPSVARYYTFEDVKDSKSVVTDLGKDGKNLTFVPYKDPVTKEVFDDLQVIEGRWKEKKAVRLDRGYYQGEAFNIVNKQFTAEVWFRRQGQGSLIAASKRNDGTILGVSGFRMGWRVTTSYEPDLTLRFSIGQPAGATNVFTKAPLPDNVWHHLAVTWDGSNMRMYVNGKLVDQTMTSIFEGDYVSTTYPFKIGYSEHGVGSVKIDVDEVVIYNRALSKKEIESLGRGPTGISQNAVFAMADAFIKAGNYRSARKEYENLKGLPNYGKEIALFNIAESYRLEKDYADAHKTYKEIFAIPNLTVYYRIYGLFKESDLYTEQKDYEKARHLYGQILKTKGALEHHIFTAGLKTGDTYRTEKKYSQARSIYERLLREQESSKLPHEGYRLDLRNRLEEIEGLADGAAVKSREEKLVEWVNRPKYAIYVSLNGNDGNIGTKNKPFATIKRAQEEIRKIKSGKGMPAGGIVVYLRGGRYFLTESVIFSREDSGEENAPVVYRSYPGEEVRLIGGEEVTGFKPLADSAIIKRLPGEAEGKVWVADLKSQGITDYGELVHRGGVGQDTPGALELFFNGNVMQIARWPNKEHVRVAGLSTKDGEMPGRGPYQFNSFVYSGDRPERWLDEKDVWLHGFWYFVFAKYHMKLKSIDTKNKIISLDGLSKIGEKAPYYVYNLLSEIDAPGEWYLDRETGKLYFYPPDKIEGNEVIVSLLNTPLVSMNEASYIVFSDITFEATRNHGVDIKKGRNNLIVASVIKNTGEWAVNIKGGFEHGVVGCDIYDTGEGGISLDFERNSSAMVPYRKEIIPARHLVKNNHIHRFNRFDGGYRQGVRIDGVGQIVTHNVIHDAPMQGIYFNANDHVIEYNELHDVVHEGRELGSIYIYGEPWYLMSRGTVIRNNYFHHLSYHSSPNLTHGLNAIHIDAINGGIVIEKNFFYKFPNGISNPQPENRMENNVFVDAEIRSIEQGDRSGLFNNPDGTPIEDIISELALRYLKRVNYKQPPWSYRYPQLIDMLCREKPVGWAMNNVIERNINTGGPFLSIVAGIKNDNIIRNNWDGDDPLFMDRKNADFRLRAGSPVYGLTGCEPLTMEGIGVYKSPLRASWPIHRTKEDIGKYYNPNWKSIDEISKTVLAPVKRVSAPLYYTIPLRKKPVTIDGRLEKDEWGGLDMKKAMVIEQFYTGEKREGAKSYAWLIYDKDNLYVAMKHDHDPFKEGMLPRIKQHMPAFEIATESQHGPLSKEWWSDDMVTGPIYSMTFNYNGEFTVNNLFSMPYKSVREVEKEIEYKRVVLDDENKVWTSEVRIPFASIGINPTDVEQLAFNIGTYKKAGWFAWVATGSSIWRVENAGFIKFEK